MSEEEEYYSRNAFIVHVKMHLILPYFMIKDDMSEKGVLKEAKKYLANLQKSDDFIAHWEVESIE